MTEETKRPRKRQLFLEIENNGFKVVTRSGPWVYTSKEGAMKAVSDYIDLIRKEAPKHD